MLNITLNVLNILFEIDDEEQETSQKTSHEKHGPGQLDLWLSMIEGNENSWIQRQNIYVTRAKKKIIFSHPLLDKLSPERIELILIAAIFKHYEVYLWPGDDLSFTNCVPLATPAEFWRTRGTAHAASRQAVEKSLSFQGVSTKDFIVLDYARYVDVIYAASKLTNESKPLDFIYFVSSLNLLKIPVLDKYIRKKVLASIEPEAIKIVIAFLPNDEEIKFIIENFPNLEIVVINRPVQKWIDAHLYKFKKFTVILQNVLENKLLVPDAPLNNLIVYDSQKLTQVAFQKQKVKRRYKSEKIWFDSDLEVDPRDNQNFDIFMIDYSKESADQDLHEIFWFVENENLYQRLVMRHEKLIQEMASAEYRKTIGEKTRKKISFHDSNLNKFSSAYYPDTQILDMTVDSLINERILEEISTYSKMLESDAFRNLEDLRLKGYHFESINLRKLKKLRRFHMEDNYNCGGLDFSECKELEVCIIKNTSILGAVQSRNGVSKGHYCNVNFEFLPKLKYVYIDAIYKGNFTVSLFFAAALKALTVKVGGVPQSYVTTLGRDGSSQLVANIQGCYNLQEVDLINSGHHINPNLRDDTYRQVRLINASIFSDVELDESEKETHRHQAWYFDPQSVSPQLEALSWFSAKTDKLETYKIGLDTGDIRNLISNRLKHIKDICHELERDMSGIVNRRPVVNAEHSGLATVNNSRIPAINTANPVLTNRNPPIVNLESAAQTEVSFFSFDNMKASVDSRTYEPNKSYIARGNISLTITARTPVYPGSHRIRVFNKIELQGKKIVLTSSAVKKYEKIQKNINSFDRETLATLLASTRASNDYALAHLRGDDLSANDNHPLSPHQVISAEDLLDVYTNPADAIEVFRVEQEQAFYFKLKPNIPRSGKIEILYQYRQNHAYENISSPLVGKQGPFVPDALSKELSKRLRNHAKLSFLFDGSLAINSKIRMLIKYCSTGEFKNEALSSNPVEDIDVLVATILEQKGSCRHRSNAFMALASLINALVNIIVNPKHEFAEVSSGTNWHRVDLGGAPLLDMTPSDKLKNIFQDVVLDLPESASFKKDPIEVLAPQEESQEAKIDPLPIDMPESKQEIDPEEKYYEKYYYQLISGLVKKTEIKTLEPLLQKTDLAALLELSDVQDPLIIRKYLCQLLAARPGKFLYIHSRADLKLYLKPYRLAKGRREQIDGPLARIIKRGGTLIVNWSNFSAGELVSFKSLIDKEPTLFGKSLSNKALVIGLKTADAQGRSAFSTRCQAYELHPDFIKFTEGSQQVSRPPDNDVTPIEVDLFGRADWREHLLGKINLSANKIKLTPGPLVRAIKEQRPLIIYNPPKDESFSLLRRQIEDESRCLYNGKFISVKDNFSVVMKDKPHPNTRPNVSVELQSNQKISVANLIYMGIHSWYELFEKLIIDPSTHKAITLRKGLLEDYQEETDAFYITDRISESDWQILLDRIAKKYPQKHFRVILAPQAKIDGLIHNDCLAIISGQAHVMLTNDPDLDAELFREEKSPLIIDVTPQTGFHHLISKTQILQQESDASRVDFFYEEMDMLKALKAGRTVILNGELSQTLYQKLLPLLTDKASITSNGERLKIPGQLFSIMPLASVLKLPLIEYSLHSFPASLYLNSFLDDGAKVASILQFYEFASKLPHQGFGRPAKPHYTFSIISRMVDALNGGKLHPHNPIKGLFNYNYPVNSADYAYLNVVGKYLFAASDLTSPRAEKILALIKRFDIRHGAAVKPHIWQLLNCFNGHDLGEILSPETLDEIISTEEGFPTVNKDVLDKLWLRINFYIDQSKKNLIIPAPQKSHVEKREWQLKILLQDPNIKFIYVKGDSGVWKTSTARDLVKALDFVLYEGEDAIEAFLKDKSEKLSILLLDEANMALPGTYDFLKGLSRDGKTVYYKSVEYQLGENQKILITGNPESFAERYYHDFFINYFETVHFKMPEDDHLDKNILRARLGEQYGEFSKVFLTVFHYSRKHNPNYTYSSRDLERVVQRFMLLAEDKNDGSSIEKKLLRSCEDEFSGTILDEAKRKIFIVELSKLLSIFSQEEKTSACISIMFRGKPLFIPQEKSYLVEAIEQDLKIRVLAVKKPQTFYNQGVLIESDFGMGKSTLYKAISEKNGFKNETDDTQNKYYEISLGDQSAYDTLLQAFHEGAVVILDELNVDSKDVDESEIKSQESLLNQLLTGKDLNGQKARRSGFMVLASQNASHEKGCKPVSQALRNRMHVMYMDNYSTQERIDIAVANNIPYPTVFVREFDECQAEYPKTNNRTFFTALNVVSQAGFFSEKNKEKSIMMPGVSLSLLSPKPNLG